MNIGEVNTRNNSIEEILFNMTAERLWYYLKMFTSGATHSSFQATRFS